VEETQHFPCRDRPSRIDVGAGGTAARLGVAGAMNVPVFGDHPAALVGNDGASVGKPVGNPHLSLPDASPRRTARECGGKVAGGAAGQAGMNADGCVEVVVRRVISSGDQIGIDAQSSQHALEVCPQTRHQRSWRPL
jgi:hypothetical protein